MDQTGGSNTGIDLDVICINELVNRDQPSSGSPIRSDPDNHSVFVNGMFKKMKGREAFLSFSRQISDVNEILTLAYSSAEDIARVILRDLALTSQVLRLVNSSFYRHFSRKGISTISEAMIILGTDEIRGLAASLKVYEMMKDLASSRLLKDKTLKGLQRSIMARHISEERSATGGDALPVSAMIYDLGEYLVALFDAQRYVEIDMMADRQGLTRAEASTAVLGISYSDLGRVLAVKLNLPEAIVRSIHPMDHASLKEKALSPGEEARCLCALVYELCEIPMDEGATSAAADVIEKYGAALDIDLRQALSLMEISHKKMMGHAELLKVDPVESVPADGKDGVKNWSALKDGLSRIRGDLDARLSIHETFTRIATVMDKSFYFDRVAISILKKKTQTMEPRFIRGEDVPAGVSGMLKFKVDAGSQDLFNKAIRDRTHLVVRDLKVDARKKGVPPWYLDGLYHKSRHQGFAVFPIFVKHKLVAMIYVDWNKKAPDLTQATVDYINVFGELMVKTFTLHS